MITLLVEKFVDYLIELLKHKETDKQNLFRDFVEPLFQQFEDVHKNYLERFHKYSEIIKNSDEPPTSQHSVFMVIEQDILFTANQRDKLAKLLQTSSDSRLFRLIELILNYLLSINDAGQVFTLPLKPEVINRNWTEINPTGFLLHNGLKTIFEMRTHQERKKPFALMAINNMVRRIQDSYQIVTEEYSKLKQDLL